MRLLLIGLLLALQGAPTPAQTTGAVEGRVIRPSNGEGIDQVQVALVRLNPNVPASAESNAITVAFLSVSGGNAFENMLTTLARQSNVAPDLLRPAYQSGIITSADGRFSFKDLVPGRYLLRVQREGFFSQRLNGFIAPFVNKTIVVEAGKAAPATEVFLMQGGTISGRVRDSQGQLAPGITVAANEVWYPQGRPAWSSQTSKATNDRGEFRLFWLPPGEYFVGTTRPAGGQAATYYPGVTDPAAAVGIQLKEGGEITGIDLDIKNAEQAFTISGTAINTVVNQRPGLGGVIDQSIASFYLIPRVKSPDYGIIDSQSRNALPANSRPNNEFEIRDVKPGIYELIPAIADYTGNHFYATRTTVNIERGNITGLKLSLSPGVTLQGELIMDGAAQTSIKTDGVRMNLAVNDSIPGIAGTILGAIPFDAAGKFRIENVPEARFAPALSGLPDGFFLSDVRQGGKSVFDEGFTVDAQANPVQIVVSATAGTVRGVVRTKDNKPYANATVVLVPPTNRRSNPRLFRVVATDDNGKFSIPGVMPSGYTIYAWGDRPFREPWLNEAYLSKYDGRGKSINVAARGIVETDLDVIP
jgi:hypothetical protein